MDCLRFEDVIRFDTDLPQARNLQTMLIAGAWNFTSQRSKS